MDQCLVAESCRRAKYRGKLAWTGVTPRDLRCFAGNFSQHACGWCWPRELVCNFRFKNSEWFAVQQSLVQTTVAKQIIMLLWRKERNKDKIWHNKYLDTWPLVDCTEIFPNPKVQQQLSGSENTREKKKEKKIKKYCIKHYRKCIYRYACKQSRNMINYEYIKMLT